MIYDLCVVGGGIVGLATAMEFLKAYPGAGVIVLEKEPAIAQHQTGHNSGVIHAGVYYKPGSLKADLCRRGSDATMRFCQEQGIPFKRTGKLIVATSSVEAARVYDLKNNATANGLSIEEIDGSELRRREPNVSGVAALFVRDSAIVDFRRISAAMKSFIEATGGRVELGVEVDGLHEGPVDVTITSGSRQWKSRQLIVCGGLQSDRLAKLAGLSIDFQIIPFRGEYYDVAVEKSDVVSHLIYPVPDPALPFLGIHLTPTIDGRLTVGPNAVLGLAREQYRKFGVNVTDVVEYARFAGFWRMARLNLKSAASEWRNSVFKGRYLQECQKYCPSLRETDLMPREAGIRAQAVTRKGELVQDFHFLQTARMLHVCNAPSPAATSAIPIAEMILAKAAASQPARRAQFNSMIPGNTPVQ